MLQVCSWRRDLGIGLGCGEGAMVGEGEGGEVGAILVACCGASAERLTELRLGFKLWEVIRP